MAHRSPTSSAVTPATRADPGQRRSACPVACSLDVIGDRWTLVLVRDLFAGKKRFGQFLASSEHIPTNILAERLKRLESAGLISTTPYSEHPLRYEYELTPRGLELAPIVDAIATWGLVQFPGTRRRSRPYSSAESDESGRGDRG